MSVVVPKQVQAFKQSVTSLVDQAGMQKQVRQLDTAQRNIVIIAAQIAGEILTADPSSPTKPLDAFEVSFLEEATALLQIDRNRPTEYGFFESIGHIFSNLFGDRISSSKVINGLQAFLVVSGSVADPLDAPTLKDDLTARILELEAQKEQIERKGGQTADELRILSSKWETVKGMMLESKDLGKLGSFIKFKAQLKVFKQNIDSKVGTNPALVPVQQQLDAIIRYVEPDELTSYLRTPEGFKELQLMNNSLSVGFRIITSRVEGEKLQASSSVKKRMGSLQAALRDLDQFKDVSALKREHGTKTVELREAINTQRLLSHSMSIIAELEQIQDSISESSDYLAQMAAYIPEFVDTMRKYAARFTPTAPPQIQGVLHDLTQLQTQVIALDAASRVLTIKEEVGQTIQKYKDQVGQRETQIEGLKLRLGEINRLLKGLSTATPTVETHEASPITTTTSGPLTKKQKLEALAGKFETMTPSTQGPILSEFGALDVTDKNGIFGKFYPKIPSSYVVPSEHRHKAGEVAFTDYAQINHSLRAAAIREYAATLA